MNADVIVAHVASDGTRQVFRQGAGNEGPRPIDDEELEAVVGGADFRVTFTDGCVVEVTGVANSHTMRLLAIIGLLVLSSLGCETEDETSTFVPTTPSIVTTTPTGPRCDANLIEVGDWWHERHMGLGDNASVEFNIYFRFTRRPPEGCQYYVFVSYVVKQRGRVVAAGAPVGESTQMHDADYPGRWYCPMQSCHSGHLAEPRGAYEIAWNWLACEIGYCTRTELQPPD